MHERAPGKRAVAVIDAPGVEALAGEAGLPHATIVLAPLDRSRPRLRCDGGGWVYPASMIKLPLAVATAAAVAGGRLTWDEPVGVDGANMTVNDAPSPLEPGYVTTPAELVALMLTRSDNVATNVLFDRLGREAATADLRALGFRETAFRRKLSGSLPLIDDPAATGRNSHPAREAAALLERIALGAVPGAPLIARCLGEQVWNSKLSAGLAAGDRFAHKTGDTDEVSHDGGILQLANGGRFVLVVYTEEPSNEATDERFAAFMRALRPRIAAA